MGLSDHIRRVFGRKAGNPTVSSQVRLADNARYRRHPMKRPEALDIVIDAGKYFRAHGSNTELELRPIGVGYSVLIPAEQLRTLVKIANRNLPPQCDSV